MYIVSFRIFINFSFFLFILSFLFNSNGYLKSQKFLCINDKCDKMPFFELYKLL